MTMYTSGNRERDSVPYSGARPSEPRASWCRCRNSAEDSEAARRRSRVASTHKKAPHCMMLKKMQGQSRNKCPSIMNEVGKSEVEKKEVGKKEGRKKEGGKKRVGRRGWEEEGWSEEAGVKNRRRTGRREWAAFGELGQETAN